MKAIPDLSRICKKFRKGIGSLEDVVRVYQVVLKVNACWFIVLIFAYYFSASRHKGNLGTLEKRRQ
jgi:DNA mismatch repair ATPase MutS